MFPVPYLEKMATAKYCYLIKYKGTTDPRYEGTHTVKGEGEEETRPRHRGRWGVGVYRMMTGKYRMPRE